MEGYDADWMCWCVIILGWLSFTHIPAVQTCDGIFAGFGVRIFEFARAVDINEHSYRLPNTMCANTLSKETLLATSGSFSIFMGNAGY